MSEKMGDGTLRRNEKKYEIVNGKWSVISGKERHPDYTGRVKLKVGGGEILGYVSAWVRQPREPGEKPYMSLSIEYPQQESRRIVIAEPVSGTMPPPPPPVAKTEVVDIGDEALPF